MLLWPYTSFLHNLTTETEKKKQKQKTSGGDILENKFRQPWGRNFGKNRSTYNSMCEERYSFYQGVLQVTTLKLELEDKKCGLYLNCPYFRCSWYIAFSGMLILSFYFV